MCSLAGIKGVRMGNSLSSRQPCGVWGLFVWLGFFPFFPLSSYKPAACCVGFAFSGRLDKQG